MEISSEERLLTILIIKGMLNNGITIEATNPI
jgi:hypothetical protein